MAMTGDKYHVHYHKDGRTVYADGNPHDEWIKARAARDLIFASDKSIVACWVMVTNDVYGLMPFRMGETLRVKDGLFGENG